MLTVTLLGAARAEEPGAAEIVAANESARGGVEMWRRVHTLGFAGQMRVPPVLSGPRASRAERGKLDPIAIPFVMALKRPNLSRLEILYRGEPVVKIFDGKDGWMLRSMDNQWLTVAMPANMAMAESEQASLDGPLIDATAKGHKVALEGTDLLEGGPAYRLAVTLPSGVVQHVWIDKANYLDVKMDAVREINGRALPVAIWFGDYKVTEGLMIPRRVDTRTLDGTPVESMSIDSVSVNPQIEAPRFNKPPAAPANSGAAKKP